MNHLIIYAHPSEKSFSNQLKEAIVAETIRQGHTVIVRDLYEMNFNPVLSPMDLTLLKNGKTPEDIAIEQQHLSDAQLVTFIFPLWWAGYPAIVKGYIDRVFSYGFAYKAGEDGKEGLLQNKKVVLFTSMGNSLEDYAKKDLLSAFEHTLGTEIFEFCGMTIAHHQFFPQIPDAQVDEKLRLVNDALRVYGVVMI